MRYVAGVFDAPVPAAAGVRALVLAGVPVADIRMIVPGDAASPAGDPADAKGLVIVFARVPTARAASAASALSAVGAGGMIKPVSPAVQGLIANESVHAGAAQS